jgi:hypothetical protein
MATWSDVRRIVRTLPDTDEKTSYGNAAWTVHGKSFAWERPLRKADLEALGKDAPSGAILGVHTEGLEMKEALLRSDPAVYFTTPHFDGYAAVLVVLAKISKPALRDLLVESWLCRAPKRVAEPFLSSKGAKPVTRARSDKA